MDALTVFYDRKLLERAVDGTSTDLILGKIVGYRNVKVKDHLCLPIPWVEKHYDSDEDGEESWFVGYLLTIKWIKTPIVWRIRKEKTAIRRIPKGQKITFARYSKLSTK